MSIVRDQCNVKTDIYEPYAMGYSSAREFVKKPVDPLMSPYAPKRCQGCMPGEYVAYNSQWNQMTYGVELPSDVLYK